MTDLATTYRLLHERLSADLGALPDKPEEDPERTLRALWLAAKGTRRSAELAGSGELPELEPHELEALERLVSKRLEGTPLAHLTGRQRFMGLEMLSSPEALIPRKETELLAGAGIAFARERMARSGDVLVLDVCTGSGNVALALAHHVPGVRVLAADLSPTALDLARRNAGHLGLEGRVEFRCGDLLAPFDEPAFLKRVDVLTCNPPYIASAKVASMHPEISGHEPRLAFDGGAFGLTVVLRLLQEARRFLREAGWLAFEIGAGQGAALTKRMQGASGFAEVIPVQDASGIIRALCARVT